MTSTNNTINDTECSAKPVKPKSSTQLLAERMKQYETDSYHYIPKNATFVIRLDGHRFSTLLRKLGITGMFDIKIAEAMRETARDLMNYVGADCMYTCSDEISLGFISRYSSNTYNIPLPWNGRVDKLISLSAAYCSVRFYHYITEYILYDLDSFDSDKYELIFDSRILIVPSIKELVNCLIWRQRDCNRNVVHKIAKSLDIDCLYKNTLTLLKEIQDIDSTAYTQYPPLITHGILQTRYKEKQRNNTFKILKKTSIII